MKELEKTIQKISKLLLRQEAGSKSYEFYHTMILAFETLQNGLDEIAQYNAKHDMILRRLDIMERLYMATNPMPSLPSHEVIDAKIT